MEQTTKNVYQKLQECRVELQQMNLKKSGRNTFSNYDYFELADFLPKVNEMFLQKGLISLFNIDAEEASLTIIDMATSQQVKFTSPIAEATIKGANPVQCLGGTHTYLKRYLYFNALEIVENDMFDSTQGKKQENTQPQPQKAPYSASYQPQQANTYQQPQMQNTPQNQPEKMTGEQAMIIYGLPDQLKSYVCQKLQINDINLITRQQAEQVIAAFREKGVIK